MMNCLIVDDEEMSRATIEHFVKKIPHLSIVGLCADAIEASEYMLAHKIDLVFLDIEMPEISGLEFASNLRGDTSVILITSKKEYAVDAFEQNVVDYLVKPVDFNRFLKAVSKVKQKEGKSAPSVKDDEIFIKSGNKIIKVKLSEIRYIQAMADYAVIHCEGKKHIIYSTMKLLDKKLPSDKFARIHRSYIVNIQKINQIEDLKVNIGDALLPIGVSYKESFMAKLQML